MRSRTVGIALAAAAALAMPTGIAQASVGATVRGRVTDNQGRPLANVEVVAQATSLPRSVTTQTVETGHYALHALPDGDYVFTFQRENLVVHKISASVSPGELVSLDVALISSDQASGTAEPIVVTIQDRQSFIRHPLIAVTYRRDRIEMLPLLGSAASALQLGPGTLTNTVFESGVWLDDRPVRHGRPWARAD